VAASELARKVIWSKKRKTDQFKSPPYSEISLDYIESYFENLRIYHQYPKYMTDDSFRVLDVTPDHNQLLSTKYALNYIAKDLTSPFERSNFYAYMKEKRARVKTLTPVTRRMEHIPIQALIAGLLTFDGTSG